MRRRIGYFLVAILVLWGGAALADNSVLRQDGLFAMQFDNLSGTEAHAMKLKKGDQLSVNTACDSGTLETVIKRDSGEILFTTSGATAPGTFVGIQEDGIYRIMITGQSARGSVRISLDAGTQPGGETPSRLQRIQGSLGYLIEYDPDFFRYEAKDAGDFFFALENDGDPERQYDTYLWIGRYEDSLDEAVLGLLQEPGAQAQPASVINYRAARTVRLQLDNTPDAKVVVYTVVEAGQNQLFVATLTCSLENETEAGAQMRAMVDSLQFQY